MRSVVRSYRRPKLGLREAVEVLAPARRPPRFLLRCLTSARYQPRLLRQLVAGTSLKLIQEIVNLSSAIGSRLFLLSFTPALTYKKTLGGIHERNQH